MQQEIDDLLFGCTVAPMVNQLLIHVSNTPFDLIAYSQSKGMLVEAYSSVAHGEMLKNPQVKAIAGKYGISVPQLCIRYTLQLDDLPLPKTANPDHMREMPR